jgi:ribosomal protein S18 acetylase RimI-like enzyme
MIASGRPSVRLRESGPDGTGDLGWVIASHAACYGREYGFNREFEEYVLLGMAEYLRKDPAGSKLWIAELDGEPAGSVGIVELEHGQAQMRWLLVEPRARGLGLGKTLTEHALAFCRERGYAEVILWTLQTLDAARAMYRSLGFEVTEIKDSAMGGQPVVEERWSLRLG